MSARSLLSHAPKGASKMLRATGHARMVRLLGPQPWTFNVMSHRCNPAIASLLQARRPPPRAKLNHHWHHCSCIASRMLIASRRITWMRHASAVQLQYSTPVAPSTVKATWCRCHINYIYTKIHENEQTTDTDRSHNDRMTQSATIILDGRCAFRISYCHVYCLILIDDAFTSGAYARCARGCAKQAPLVAAREGLWLE